MLPRDVCIEFSSRYVFVAEQCLYKDGADAVLKQMGSETMAQRMWSDIVEFGLSRVVSD